MLKRISVLIFNLALFSSLNIFLSLSYATPLSIKCDMAVESPATGRSEGKLFIKGNKSRIELNTAGMHTITIVNEQNAYMYMPAQNMAMTLGLSQAKGQVPDVADYKKNCDHIREEMMNGEPCGVYRCSKGGEAVMIWVPHTFDFPFKVESGATTTYYYNIDTNAYMDDDLFNLPQGVQFQDMSGLMQGFKGILNSGGNKNDY